MLFGQRTHLKQEIKQRVRRQERRGGASERPTEDRQFHCPVPVLTRPDQANGDTQASRVDISAPDRAAGREGLCFSVHRYQFLVTYFQGRPPPPPGRSGGRKLMKINQIENCRPLP